MFCQFLFAAVIDVGNPSRVGFAGPKALKFGAYI